MPRTPDRYPGAREESELQLKAQGEAPTIAGAQRYVSGSFSFKDSIGVFDPRAPIAPSAIGEVLFCVDGSSFTAETPLVSHAGWLVNDEGTLLVVG